MFVKESSGHMMTSWLNMLGVLLAQAPKDSPHWESMTQSLLSFWLLLLWTSWWRNSRAVGDLRRQDFHVKSLHNDVIKWNHFPRYWPFVRGIHRSPVNSTHKGQWRRALMFSLICAWINGWENIGEAGYLRLHRTHYDVTAMLMTAVLITHLSQVVTSCARLACTCWIPTVNTPKVLQPMIVRFIARPNIFQIRPVKRIRMIFYWRYDKMMNKQNALSAGIYR